MTEPSSYSYISQNTAHVLPPVKKLDPEHVEKVTAKHLFPLCVCVDAAQPVVKLDAQFRVMCVAVHPSQPEVFLCGGYSPAVKAWDLRSAKVQTHYPLQAAFHPPHSHTVAQAAGC